MGVYRVEDDDMSRIDEDDLSSEAALERRLLRADGLSLGGLDLLWIGQQDSPGEAGIFDILALDDAGDPVIVELKHGKAPREIVTQALEYASEIRAEEYADLDDRYRDFRNAVADGGHPDELADAHRQFFDLEEELDGAAFNTTQRLILVGENFKDLSVSMAEFLRDHGIDVSIVTYNSSTDESGLELLETDAIRESLRNADESGEAASASKTYVDYSDILMRAREPIYAELADELSLDEPADLFAQTESRNLTAASGVPSCPESVRFDLSPRIEEQGMVSLKLTVWAESDESRHREIYHVIDDLVDEDSGFEMASRKTTASGLAEKTIPVQEWPDEATLEMIVEEYVEMVRRFHSTLVEHF